MRFGTRPDPIGGQIGRNRPEKPNRRAVNWGIFRCVFLVPQATAGEGDKLGWHAGELGRLGRRWGSERRREERENEREREREREIERVCRARVKGRRKGNGLVRSCQVRFDRSNS